MDMAVEMQLSAHRIEKTVFQRKRNKPYYAMQFSGNYEVSRNIEPIHLGSILDHKYNFYIHIKSYC